MKNFLPYLLTLSLATACNNNSHDNVRLAEKENAKKADSQSQKASITDSASILSQRDAFFVDKAMSGSMLEVQLGELAQSRGASPGVRSFGAMMVRDHGRGGEELRSLAHLKGIVLPDSVSNDQKKERDNLAGKTGKDFDHSYIDLMVKDHKEDIQDFTKATKDVNNPDIKSWASKALPMLREHLDSAQYLQKHIDTH